MYFLYNNVLNNYNLAALFVSYAAFTALMVYGKKWEFPNEDSHSKPKWYAFAYVAMFAAALVAGAALNYAVSDTYMNSVIAGYIMAMFTKLAVDDLFTGEVMLGHILLFIASTVVLCTAYNFLYGCNCVAKWVGLTVILFAVFTVLNEFYNSESSIGGADMYIIETLVFLNIAYMASLMERGVNAMVSVNYWLLLTQLIFVNFFGYFVLYVAVMKLKKKKLNGVRCLPIFYLPMFLTVLGLLQ